MEWNGHRVRHTHFGRTVAWTLSYSYTHRKNSGMDWSYSYTQTQSQGEQWNGNPVTYTHTHTHTHTHTQGKHWWSSSTYTHRENRALTELPFSESSFQYRVIRLSVRPIGLPDRCFPMLVTMQQLHRSRPIMTHSSCWHSIQVTYFFMHLIKPVNVLYSYSTLF